MFFSEWPTPAGNHNLGNPNTEKIDLMVFEIMGVVKGHALLFVGVFPNKT